MASFAALATGSLGATVLALLAIFLYQVHRQAGLIPFIFLMTVLAMVIPLAGHASSMTLADGWTAPGVAATVAGAYIALVLLTHLLAGSQNALTLAALPAGAGVLASGLVVAAGWTSLVLPAGLIPAHAATPLLAGITLSAGTYLALTLMHGVTRRWETARPALHVLPAALIGTLGQGLLMAGLVAVGLGGLEATWQGTAVAPLILGLIPMVLIALFVDHETADLPTDERQALVSQSVFGGDSLVEAYEQVQHAYEKGVLHGEEKAEPFIELLESQPVGTYICDDRGKVAYGNLALGELLGQSDEAFEGKNITHLLATITQQGRPRPAAEALDPGTHRISVAMPSGRQRLLELEVSKTDDGRIRGHVTDLTHELGRLELERQRRRTAFYVDLLSKGVLERLAMPIDVLGQLADEPAKAPMMQGDIEAAETQVTAIGSIVDHVEMMAAAEEIEADPMDAMDLLERAADRAQASHGDDLAVKSIGPDETVLIKASPMIDRALDTLVDLAVEHAQDEQGLELALQSRGPSGWVLTVGYIGQPPPDRFRQLLAGEAVPDKTGEHLGGYAIHALVKALGGWARVETGAHRGRAKEVGLTLHLPKANVDPAAWRMMGVSDRRARS